jgi:drug/metabolite transporter (DMT)-like permease/transposase
VERWQGLDRAKGDYGAGAAREDRDLGLGRVRALGDGAAGRLESMRPRHRSCLRERRRKAPVSTYRRAEHDGEAVHLRGEGPEGKAGPAAPAGLALAALLAGAAGIAFAPIFVKISEVGPVATAFWRVLLALPILWAWMEIEGRRSGKPGRPSGPRDLLALFASGLFLGSTFALWHLSLGLTSVANSTLLVNLAPVFVALGAWLFLGQRSGATFLVGMAMALGGAALLVAGGPSRLGGGEMAGDGLAALAAVFYAGYFLSASGLRPRFSTAAVMAYGAPAACAALLPVSPCSRARACCPPPGRAGRCWQPWHSSPTSSARASSPTLSPGCRPPSPRWLCSCNRRSLRRWPGRSSARPWAPGRRRAGRSCWPAWCWLGAAADGGRPFGGSEVRKMPEALVSEGLWEVIGPLLPAESPKPKGGRPRVPDRAALEGIVYVLRSGIPWRMLPEEFGCSGVTCWRRLRDWQEAGVWQRLRRALLDRLGQAGLIDWSRASVDSASTPAKKGGEDRSQPGGPR